MHTGAVLAATVSDRTVAQVPGISSYAGKGPTPPQQQQTSSTAPAIPLTGGLPAAAAAAAAIHRCVKVASISGLAGGLAEQYRRSTQIVR